MDIMMPEVDGLTAVKKIRRMESAAEVPPERRAGIVMLSSLSDAKHMMEAQYECGADLYLTKPVERDTLLEALANLGLTVGPFMENDRIPPKS
jgi:two-component system chemotaxis response regulator CheY